MRLAKKLHHFFPVGKLALDRTWLVQTHLITVPFPEQPHQHLLQLPFRLSG
jgi:hypothetical protein